MGFNPRRVGLVTQTQVDGEVLCGSPIVLNIPGKNVRPMTPLSSGNALAVGGGQSEVEIGAAVAPTAGVTFVGSDDVNAPLKMMAPSVPLLPE